MDLTTCLDLCFEFKQARTAASLQLAAEEASKSLLADKESLTAELSSLKVELLGLIASSEEERAASESRCVLYEDEVLRLRERMEASMSSLALAGDSKFPCIGQPSHSSSHECLNPSLEDLIALL